MAFVAAVEDLLELASIAPIDSATEDLTRLGGSAKSHPNLRGAAVPTNIAEGSKRTRNRDYARFLNIAEGSLAAVEYLIRLSKDLGFLPETHSQSKLSEVDEIAHMLHGLPTKVEQAP